MRKKYSLPLGITDEISQTVDLVKNNIGTLNYRIVPIHAIEFDPANPRELAITRDDLTKSLATDDPLYRQKSQELESLQQLADTIKKYGVRNAIEIYKHGNSYRLIHGERRCLGSILAGKTDIPAKILDDKPNEFDIRLLQMIENVQREDLTLYEMLNNIRQVITEYKHHVDADVEVDAAFLETLINRSKTHCLNFLAVLNANDELQRLIKQGTIKNLEKAAIIARAKTPEQRDILLKHCLEGASLLQLKQKALQYKRLDYIKPGIEINLRKRPGKIASKINLGTTQKMSVISKIIELVAKDPLYAQFKSQFKQMSLNNYNDCASAFSLLIKIMEKVEVR